MDDKTINQAQMFSNRLQKRFAHLKKWAARTGAGVFRLYDRDIPEIPLVLDFYGNPRDAALAGALYKRPYDKDENEEALWLAAMKHSAAHALQIDEQNIFIKYRQRQRGKNQYEKLSDSGFVRVISEGGLSFKVNLSDYLDCGLFPDRRLLRAMIKNEAAGKKVLNLFSYTAAFSVYAASGGAESTDSVDLSNTYLAWAEENFSLNGYAARPVSHIDQNVKHRLIHADVLDFLHRVQKTRWDIIILDPPAFSNSKKMKTNIDLNRDKTELIARCLDLLAPGGKIFFSINAKVKADELRFPNVVDLGGKMVDEDFKGRKTSGSFLITM
jgi:23S rRNA G2069 N7-methylase RlmK/C1962 C5-methylase RlmI